MPIDMDELAGPAGDELAQLRLEIGEKFVGTLVDIDSAPHYVFGSTTEVALTAGGKPKTKWIARLRPDGATSQDTDLKWWTQNQVKYELVQAVREIPQNYRGARIQITRLPDGVPSNPAYKPPHQYEVKIKPGPDGWVDPLAPKADVFDDEEPF